MIVRTAYPGTPPTVIPAEAGMMVRTAQAGTPPTVIPAKAGIQWALSEPGCAGGCRTLATCDEGMSWPRRGVYVRFEDGETRSDYTTNRRRTRATAT